MRDEALTVTNRPYAGYVSPSQVFFVLNSCAAGETVRVTVALADGIPRDPQIYKVAFGGTVGEPVWTDLPGAVVDYSNKTVSYDLVDNGDLDSDKTPGVIVDPMIVLGSAPPDPIAEPLPLPNSVMWLLMALVGLFSFWQMRVGMTTNVVGDKA